MRLQAAKSNVTTQVNAAPKESDLAAFSKIAVLFNGPSLPRYWRDSFYDNYDLVIAVNTAAWHYKCDWANCVDADIIPPLLRGEWPPPCKGFITNTAYGAMAMAKGWQWYLPKLYNRTGPQMRPSDAPVGVSTDGTGYTAVNALYTAIEWLKPGGEIEIYGMDFSNAPLDFSGKSGSHDDGRWKNEGSWFRLIWDDRIKKIHGEIAKEWIEYFKS